MIIFFYDKILRFNVYLLINKFNKIVFIAFKSFFNNVKYDDYKYIHLRNDYDKKYDNYKIKIY